MVRDHKRTKCNGEQAGNKLADGNRSARPEVSHEENSRGHPPLLQQVTAAAEDPQWTIPPNKCIFMTLYSERIAGLECLG